MAKNLPSISSKLPQDVRNFLDRVAEFVRGSDGFLTRKQLKDAGIITDDQWGNIRDPLYDATVPPAPTNVQASGAIENIILTWDKAPYRNHAYAEVWGAETNVLGNAVLVGRTEASVFSHSIGPKNSRYYWVRFVSTGGVVGPYQGTTGVLGVTAYNPADLVTELAGLITESELATDLNSRIDLIDGPDTLNGSVNKRVLDEATARVNSITTESEARIRETQANANAILEAALGLDLEVINRQGGIATAYSDLQTAFQAGDYAEAQARLALQATLQNADTNLNAAILVEQTARVTQDNALAQQITLLSAGTGEQFDWKQIWYFDSGVESWTGNGTPTASAGWLRPANSATAYVESPVGIGALGSQYTQVRLRIRKTGNPTFAGYIYWRASSDSTWDVARRAALATPSYDGSGISVLTLDMPSGWTSITVDRIRVDLSAVQDVSNYFEIDWVAIGRPSPGASQAQVIDLQTATADMQTKTLSASSEQTLITNYTSSNTRVFIQATAPVQGSTTITLSNGTQSAPIPTIRTGDIWYDSDDGMKPHTWNGSTWVYSPDTSAAASSAFTTNWSNAMSSQTGSSASSWQGLYTAFYDPTTGLSATKSGLDTLSTSVATNDAARAGENKTLYAQSQGSAERDLSSILTGEATRTKTNETLAAIQQDLNVQIVTGLLAEATARQVLATQVGEDIAAAIVTEQIARSTADSAEATARQALATTVDGHTASIQTQASSINGIKAQYTVKIDNNGYVAGYGLSSTLIDGGTATSQFIASVDQFAVATPSSSLTLRQPSTAYVRGVSKSHAGSSSLMLVAVVGGTTSSADPLSVPDWTVGKQVNDGSVVWQIASRVPFSIFTNSQVVNGQTIPAGVYIDGAMVVTGTINNAQIGNGAIDDAKVAGLSATKITTGFIDAARIDAGTVTATHIEAGTLSADNIHTRGLTVRDNAGAIILASGVNLDFAKVGGTTKPADGATKNTLTQSASAPSGGADGDFHFNTATKTLYQKIGGNWVTAADVTASNTAAGIAGQGAFATLSQIPFGQASTYIANGAIGNAQIGGTISSDNYVNGSAGWAIAKDGTAEFNNGLFRGQLVAATGSFAGSLTAASGIFTGTLTAASIGSGSQLIDANSGQALDSAAIGIWQVALIADSAYTKQTNSAVKFYGPSAHSTTPRSNRLRAAPSTRPLRFTLSANAVVDHYFSLWFRTSGAYLPSYTYTEGYWEGGVYYEEEITVSETENGYTGWTWLTDITTPEGGYGPAPLVAATPELVFRTIGGTTKTDFWVEFAVGVMRRDNSVFSTGADDIRQLSVVAQALNM